MGSRGEGINKKCGQLLVCGLLVATLSLLGGVGGTTIRFACAATKQDPSASAKAFLIASRTLLHPRCVNCHPEGDHPLVGDHSRPHPMSIERGPDGMGVAGLSCSGCHQDNNLRGEHTPPGAPDWHLPTKKMPMVFENRTPRKLCEQLKDPSRNGGRNVDQVLEHVQDAPLVKWGWHPGGHRTAVPGTHDDFVRVMTEWVRKGAACPE